MKKLLNSTYIFLIFMLSMLFAVCVDTKRVTNVQESISTDILVDIYDKDRADIGTTLFTYRYDTNNPKILEVDMHGEIVWQYQLNNNLKQYIKYGFDAELLPQGRLLVMLPRYAVIEMTRNGNITWGYTNEKLSHDADRLENGHTIMTFGANDQISDVQITELDRDGFIFWQWSAKDHFNDSRYQSSNVNGWTRTNAVERLENGNTMVCLCNFHLIAELDTTGNVIKEIGEGLLYHPHDPEVLSNGNILVASQKSPHQDSTVTVSVFELNPVTNQVVWKYENKDWFNSQLTRDANRLSNGNTLITGSTQIIEVTPEGEIVWRLKIKDANLSLNSMDFEARGFYKSQRIKY